MPLFSPRSTPADDSLTRLEKQLSASLTPVRANPEFVDRLYHRLTLPSEIEIERKTGALSILLVAAGLCLGLLLLFFFQQGHKK